MGISGWETTLEWLLGLKINTFKIKPDFFDFLHHLRLFFLLIYNTKVGPKRLILVLPSSPFH